MTPSFPRTGVSGHAGAVQRGDGNLHPESPYARNASNVSSDPKPREGTETRNPAPHPQLRHAPEVVRPKTPRGDGNSITLFLSVARLRVSSDPKPREGTETPRGWRMRCARKCRQTQNPERGRKREEPSHLGLPPAGRQTQNPERGRKLVRHLCLIQVQCPVVRPKTPRGDGNPTMASKSAWVTDPGRQTQNPERGRKHFERELVHSPPFRSSDPKPREGTETLMVGHGRARLSGSSDPKPREGTETGRRIAPGAGGAAVVRPKTPRGDGNTPPMTAMSE
ncbi:Uncharacterised protein [Mycobacterium tuberculosis]|nr:Uncharacterised protein [Mycobacterium tuberculosis]